jgi:hypothetical protein
MELMRQLGVSYNTAWSLKYKLLQTMLERDANRQLTGVIAVDDVYWGGACHGQTPGRGSPNKIPLVAALSKSLDARPLALRLSVVAGFRKREIAAWTEKFIHPDSIVVTGGGAASVELEDFRWLNTVLGNVKNALHGTYTTSSAPSICRATWPSSATASTAASTSPPCCRAWAMPPPTRRPCPTGCSSWLRLIGNQGGLSVTVWRHQPGIHQEPLLIAQRTTAAAAGAKPPETCSRSFSV